MTRLSNSHTPFAGSVQFLAVLYATYTVTTRQPYGVLEKLKHLYRILVMLPFVGRKYTLDAFAVDVYRLDRHCQGADAWTGPAYRLDRGSTAARKRSNLLVTQSMEGVELTYYGIEFLVDSATG